MMNPQEPLPITWVTLAVVIVATVLIIAVASFALKILGFALWTIPIIAGKAAPFLVVIALIWFVCDQWGKRR